jgi:DNA-binding PadR family transcriptional regulator
MHGYALAEALGGGLGPAVDLKPPTVYAILKRFEDRGWIRGEVERDGAAPLRTVFTVTQAGEHALPKLALAVAEATGPSPQPLAALIAHLDQVPPNDRGALVSRLLNARRARLSALSPWKDHPGSLGRAVELLLRQLRLEIEVLESLVDGPLG